MITVTVLDISFAMCIGYFSRQLSFAPFIALIFGYINVSCYRQDIDR